MSKINVYLNFAGNTEEAFNFYKLAFGGNFSSLVRFKEMPMEGVTLSPEDGNKIMHVSLPVGENTLMGTDMLESLGHKLIPGNNINVSIHPESKEEADRLFKALSVGGAIEMPMEDQAWGDYYGSFEDQFGIKWMLNYSYPQKD